jgi:hypothetical protein
VEAVSTFEMSVNFYNTTQGNNSKDRHLRVVFFAVRPEFSNIIYLNTDFKRLMTDPVRHTIDDIYFRLSIKESHPASTSEKFLPISYAHFGLKITSFSRLWCLIRIEQEASPPQILKIVRL